MVQILEIALIAGMDKENDLPQPCFGNRHVDSLSALAAGTGNIDLGDLVGCILQGIDVRNYNISPSIFFAPKVFSDVMLWVHVSRRGLLLKGTKTS